MWALMLAYGRPEGTLSLLRDSSAVCVMYSSSMREVVASRRRSQTFLKG